MFYFSININCGVYTYNLFGKYKLNQINITQQNVFNKSNNIRETNLRSSKSTYTSLSW